MLESHPRQNALKTFHALTLSDGFEKKKKRKRKKQPSIVVKAKGGPRRRVTLRFPASIIFFYLGPS